MANRHSAFGINERAALGILACAVTALVYQGSLDLPFVFDDRTTVLLNPSLVDRWDFRALLLYDLPRTVANVSYGVDRAFWGFSAFGFHVTNFVLHVIVVGLFYGWCTRALADGVRLRPKGAGRDEVRLRPYGASARQHPGSDQGLTPGVEWPAFFAAATFGLHPLMGATAAYVSARSELLCALGVLAALIYARRAIVASSVSAGVLASAFGAFALGSSGAAAGLPVVVLAYDAWVLRDPGWRRRLWRVYVPALVVVGLIAAWDLRAVLPAARVPPRGLLDNVLTEAIVIWRYVGLLLVPYGQSLVHQVHWATTTDPLALLALAALVAALVAAVRARQAAPLAAFGAIWSFAALAATSTFVPLRDAMAEPRAYVAGAGLVLAAASLLAEPLATRRAARGVAVSVLVILAVLTHVRNTIWAEPLRLWEESVERSPQAWQAHLGYAEALREIRQCARAIPEYETALRLNPNQPHAEAGLKECRR
jgi:protein O-mannosyl-transferase